MARRYKDSENVSYALIRSMVKDGTYSDKTIAHTRQHCKIVIRYLKGRSLYQITPEDVKAIHSAMINDGLAVATQKNYIFILKKLLAFIDNPAHDVKIVFQADTRPNVDWLTPEEARTVLDAPLTPIQGLTIVLALCMGLRRVEIIRLKVSDIDYSKECISVIGKGRAGGKLRLVPFHPRFIKALTVWLKVRSDLCLIGNGEAPENLLIWRSNADRRLYPYNAVKGSGIDGIIRRASESVNIHFSAHTLRRTFGRIMWLSGVSVIVIARILGHSSTEQTLQYIGANLDDMAGAMNTFFLK